MAPPIPPSPLDPVHHLPIDTPPLSQPPRSVSHSQPGAAQSLPPQRPLPTTEPLNVQSRVIYAPHPFSANYPGLPHSHPPQRPRTTQSTRNASTVGVDVPTPTLSGITSFPPPLPLIPQDQPETTTSTSPTSTQVRVRRPRARMAIGMEEDLDFENEDTIFKVGERDEPEVDPSLLINFPKLGPESPRKARIRETTGGTVVMGSDDGSEGSKGRAWMKRKGLEGKEKLVDARLVIKGDEVGIGRNSFDQGSTSGSTAQIVPDVEATNQTEDVKGKGKEKPKKGLMSKLGFRRKGDKEGASGSTPLANAPGTSFLDMGGKSKSKPLAPIEVSPFAYDIAAGSLRSAASSRSNISFSLGTAIEDIDPITGKLTRRRYNEEIDRRLPPPEDYYPIINRGASGRSASGSSTRPDKGTSHTPGTALEGTSGEGLSGEAGGTIVDEDEEEAVIPMRIRSKAMEILGEDAATIQASPFIPLPEPEPEPILPSPKNKFKALSEKTPDRPSTGKKKATFATPSKSGGPYSDFSAGSSKSTSSPKLSSHPSTSSLAPRSILRRPSTDIPPVPPLPDPAEPATNPIRTSTELTLALTVALVPPFPTSIPRLEAITLSSSPCMRRSAPPFSSAHVSSSPEKSGSMRNLASFARPSTGGGKKEEITWTRHQIVLTVFKINEPSPTASPASSTAEKGKGDSKADPDPTRTIAHLHLFEMPSPVKNSPNRPATGSIFSTSSSKKARPTTAPGLYGLSEESAVEVDRRLISGDTIAGVWDAGAGIGWDEARGELITGMGKEKEKEFERDWKGRNCVIRVGFGVVGEWFLDMPDMDARHEWVKQIKDFAVLIRAEQAGHGKLIRDALARGLRTDLSLLLDQTISYSRTMSTISSLSSSTSSSQPVTQPNSASRTTEYPSRFSSEHSDSDFGSRNDLAAGDPALEPSAGDDPVGVMDFLQKQPSRDPKSQREREREIREAGLVAVEAEMRKEEEEAERRRLQKQNEELEEQLRIMRIESEAKRVAEAEAEWARVQAVKREMVERYEREKKEMEERFEREKKELEEKYTPDGRLRVPPKIGSLRQLDMTAARSQEDLRLPPLNAGVEASAGHRRQKSGSAIDNILRPRDPSSTSPAGSIRLAGSSGSPASLGRRSTMSSGSSGPTRRHLLPAPVPPPAKPLPAIPVSPTTEQLTVTKAKIPTKYLRFQATQMSTSSDPAPLPAGSNITLGEPINRDPSPSKVRPMTGTTLAWDRLIPDESDAIGRLRVRSDKTASVVSARAFFKDDLRELEALEGEDRQGLRGTIDEETEEQEREREMNRIREMDVATPEFLTPLEEVGELDVSQAGPSTVQLEGIQRSGALSSGALMGGMERLESSASSLQSSGTGTTGGGRRRLRPQTPALDIMDEFKSRTEIMAASEEPMPVIERKKAIRFAEE